MPIIVQLTALTTFHAHMFGSVLKLDKSSPTMSFDMEESTYPVILAPLVKRTSPEGYCTGVTVGYANAMDTEDAHHPVFDIDMSFVEKCNRELTPSAERRPSEEKRRQFKFDAAKFENAVVTPWYRPAELPTHFYVAEILDKKTPASAFPDDNFKSFNHYFEHKYKIEIFDQTQPMLDADYTTGRLNILTSGLL